MEKKGRGKKRRDDETKSTKQKSFLQNENVTFLATVIVSFCFFFHAQIADEGRVKRHELHEESGQILQAAGREAVSR